jgi:hypothetical protein
MIRVAALFVEKGGVYWDLPGVDAWDKVRDAKQYAGPHPHPPCQLWINMAGHNFIRYTKERGKPQPHLRPGNDGGCFACALRSVQRWGGVLEHPARSHAWATFALRKPDAGRWSTDGRGGWTCEVAQSAYGHQARKLTWLYYVGPEPPELLWKTLPGVAQVGWFDRSKPTLSKKAASATPVPFRDLLLELARKAAR